MSVGRYIYIPIETAITPAEGHAYVNRWWSVHPEHGVAFWYQPFGYEQSEDPSPQCNASEAAARALNKDGHEIKFFPVVFGTHAWRAMRSDKKSLRVEKR